METATIGRERWAPILVVACFALAVVVDLVLTGVMGGRYEVTLLCDAGAAAGLLVYWTLRPLGVFLIAATTTAATLVIVLNRHGFILRGLRLEFVDAVHYQVPNLGELLALALLAASPAFVASTRHLVAIVPLSLISLLQMSARSKGGGILATAGVLGAIWAVSFSIGLYVRGVSQRNDLLAGQARLDERLSIARELHDTVAHHVTGIVVRAQAAQLVTADQPTVHTAFADIERAGGDALRSMRSVVASLRGASADGEVPLAPTDPLADIESLRTEQSDAGPPVVLNIDPRASITPDSARLAASRIAVEAVTNARRHAREATSIKVDLAVEGTALRLTVTDDGRPGAIGRQGFGITGMRERASALGGTLHAGPRLDGGWRVEALIPLETATVRR